MNGKFEVGDMVRFKKFYKYWYGKTFRLKEGDYGTIVEIKEEGWYCVRFDKIREKFPINEKELEKIDEVKVLIDMTKEEMK